MRPPEITDKDLPAYRRDIAVKQKYICGICGCSLGGVKHALDHGHHNGMLRGVLCNTCNRSEGKLKKGAEDMVPNSHLIRRDFIQWMKNLIEYLEHHDSNPSHIIHPTYDLKKGKQRPKKRVVKRRKPK